MLQSIRKVMSMSKLRELRKAKNMTQSELAKEINVSEKTISRWEKDDTLMKANKAKELADYFNVSVSYLLGYSDKKEPYYSDEILLDNGSGGAVSLSEKRDSDIIQKYNEQLFNSFEKFLNDFNFVISDSEIESFVKLLSYYNVNNMSHPLFLEALKRQNINQSKKFLKDNGYSKLGDNFQSTKAFDDFKKSIGYDTDHIL
jgi:transcriptional regulator with XRE-family HTH domain